MFRFLILFLSVFFFAPLLAFAVDVNQDVTLVLPGDGLSYTLKSGATFDTLVVKNSAFDFTMSASQSLTLTSADKKGLPVNNSNFTATESCESSQSKLVLSLPAGDPQQTTSVTPSGTCTSATTAASTGGGGGGSVYTNPEEGGPPSPIVAAKPPPPPITPAPAVAQPSPVAQVVSPVFNRNLTLGSRGDDVKALQEFLAKDPQLYPEGIISGYFGRLTEAAVERFQERHGIAAAGVPGYGHVGPKTRAKLNELLGAAPAVTVPAAAPTAPAALPAAAVFTRGLGLGVRGDDVTQLQALLSGDKELYPEGIVSGYFGPLTENAVERFQEKYGIAGSGVPGYGFVGPKTRAKLNELIGVPVGVPAPAAPALAPSSADEQARIQALQEQLRLLQEQLQKLQSSQ